MSKYNLILSLKNNRIDLAGPQGNVFQLIGLGRKWLIDLEAPKLEREEFSHQMMNGDYRHALEVFKSWFGEDIIYNSDED